MAERFNAPVLKFSQRVFGPFLYLSRESALLADLRPFLTSEEMRKNPNDSEPIWAKFWQKTGDPFPGRDRFA
jgi:hypothetical protein